MPLTSVFPFSVNQLQIYIHEKCTYTNIESLYSHLQVCQNEKKNKWYVKQYTIFLSTVLEMLKDGYIKLYFDILF